MKNVFLVLIFIFNSAAYSAETCSRIATINYQDVLVDTDSSQKGEGLRYHLEKDPIAKSYLDVYQENSKIKWQNTLLGTVGTGMLISSFVAGDDIDRRQTLLVGGLAMIAINFLVARTLEKSNELNLTKAIDEYNKRNLPKIFFNTENNTESDKKDFGVSINKDWSF
ncbi:MAG: hypothetical protein GY909_12410 [Oligoflexia bacterium]|nr:hypothetical protein [Oligoflexia bacterium]